MPNKFQTLIFSLCLSAPGLLLAQPMLPRDQAFETLASQTLWVECSGRMEGETFLAKEIQIIAANDSANMEDLQIYGEVTQLDRRRSSMNVLGYRIEWDKDTTIKDENKHRILSSKLKNNTGVKIQGFLAGPNVFKATKIKLKAGKIKNGKFKAKEKIVGPVVASDAASGWLKIMDTDVKVRPDCAFMHMPPEYDNQAE